MHWFDRLLAKKAESLGAVENLEKAEASFFADLRFFITQKIAQVGMAEDLSDTSARHLESVVTAASFTQELEKYLNEDHPVDSSFSEVDRELNQITRRAFIESRPMPITPRVAEALRRMQYLREKYPHSGASIWVMKSFKKLPRGSAGLELLCELGKLALGYSEHISHLRILRAAVFLEGEQKALKERILEKFNALNLPNFSGGKIEVSPEDQVLLAEIIHDQTTGRHAFITDFFACWFSVEKTEEKIRLLSEWLSQESPVTDEFIEAYQLQHRRGIELYLSVEVMNLILLHALRTPFSERTGIFKAALTQIVDFIRRGFDGLSNEWAVRQSSYPEELFTLVRSELIEHEHEREDEHEHGLGMYLMIAEVLMDASEYEPVRDAGMVFVDHLSGVLEVLVEEIRHPKSRALCRENAIAALSNLALDPVARDKTGQIPGIFETLVEGLKGAEFTAKEKGYVSVALGNLVIQHSSNAAKIADIPGIFETLVQRLSGPDLPLKYRDDSANALFRFMVVSSDFREKIAAIPRVFEALVSFVKAATFTEITPRHALNVLKIFVADSGHREKILCIPEIFKILGDFFTTANEEALKIIIIILEHLVFYPLDPAGTQSIFAVFESLRDCMLFPEEYVLSQRIHTRIVLYHFFVALDDVSKRGSRSQIFAALTHALVKDPSVLVEYDVVAVAPVKQLRMYRILNALIDCLRSDDLTSEEQDCVLDILEKYSRDCRLSREKIGKIPGAVEVILTELFAVSSNKRIEKIISILFHLSLHDFNREQICRTPGIFIALTERLLCPMREISVERKIILVGFLAELAREPQFEEFQKDISERLSLPILIREFEESASVSARSHYRGSLFLLFRNLACHSKIRELMRGESRVFEIVIRCLSAETSNANEKEEAAAVFVNLVSNVSSQKYFPNVSKSFLLLVSAISDLVNIW